MSEEDNFNCKAGNQLRDTLYKDILNPFTIKVMCDNISSSVLDDFKYNNALSNSSLLLLIIYHSILSSRLYQYRDF